MVNYKELEQKEWTILKLNGVDVAPKEKEITNEEFNNLLYNALQEIKEALQSLIDKNKK